MDLVGKQLGNYRIIRHLGRGGFADVYLGEHHYLNTQAAIKVMYAQMSQSDLQDFLVEARTIAALKHPHIVRILEFGQENELPYLVMDYAPQGILRQRHPRGTALPMTTVLPYVRQVSQALQYAHDNKVVHRDVKPENMLMDANGQILLSDFGIAVISHSTSSMMTQRASGTPYYMAPEQWKGKSRPASDQYALGIVVYEWLSGEYPFQGNQYAVQHQHLSEPPPPFDKSLQIPSYVEAAVQKALAKEPEQRFPSVEAFRLALEQAGSPGSSPYMITPTSVAFQEPAPAPALQVMTPQIRTPQLPQGATPNTTGQQPTGTVDIQVLYQEGVKARERGNFKQAVNLWQEIIDRHDPNFEYKTFIPQMVKLLRQRAMQAGESGEWQEAITSWKSLLKWEKQNAQALEYLPIAEQNQKYAWIYQNAQQFVADRNYSAAKKLLEEVWEKKNAPYYGDPAGLAKKVGMKVPPSYETVKETQRKASLTREISVKDAQRKAQRSRRRADMADGLDIPLEMLRIYYFGIVAGIGSAVGLFTQSWLWGGIAAIVVAVLAYLLGYFRVIEWYFMLLLVALGVAATYGLSYYAATLSYDQTLTGQFWFLGDRTLWVGRQIDAGVVFGAISSFYLDYRVLASASEDAFNFGCWTAIFLVLAVIIWWLIPVFGGGFGYGPGLPFALLGLAVGLIGGVGVITAIRICVASNF